MHPDLDKAGLWNRASIYWSNADDTRLQSQFFRLISICVVHWRYILGYQHNLQRHNRENSYCPCVDAQNPWWNTFGHHKGNEETNKVDPQASFLSQIGNVSTISFVLQSHDTECDSRTMQDFTKTFALVSMSKSADIRPNQTLNILVCSYITSYFLCPSMYATWAQGRSK